MNQVSPSSTSLLTFLFFALFIIPFFFYLVTLQNTLKAIAPENRKMNPSQVWFLFIPLFGLAWHFVIVARLSDSIKTESFGRDIELKELKPGYYIGIAMCIFNCTTILPQIFGTLSSVTAMAFIICWIIYWAKIASYKKQILNSSVITLDAELEAPEK